MNTRKRFSEDDQIIGTPMYFHFQKMCTEAGLFAEKEARDRGLPLTYVEDDNIIKEYADGRKKIIGKAKPRVKVSQKVYKIPCMKKQNV